MLIISIIMTTTITTGLNSDVCIDVGESEMTCTREVLEMRTQYDDVSINVGVTQRIDGSESEKQAVRDVLKHMDNYFFHEVLALQEYEYARSRWYVQVLVWCMMHIRNMSFGTVFKVRRKVIITITITIKTNDISSHKTVFQIIIVIAFHVYIHVN